MLRPPQAAPVKADRVVLPHGGDRSSLPTAGAVAAPEHTLTLDPAAVRDLMWRSAGLFRTHGGLVDAVRRLDRAYATEVRRIDLSSRSSADDWRRLNLLTVALLIARAALRREESRGGHFREDFPARDDLHWQVHLVDQRDAHGQE